MTAALVALAGALGAALRYLVDRTVAARLGDERPWGTFAVNVTGCLAAGLLGGASGRARDVVLVGLVGSYTTFSTYAVEVVKVDAASRPAAVGYALGSLVLGVLAAALGLALG
ncbi:MAG TPA: CrcB family protein [Frankiaceae bacterium]|nr:CrcB family protein [Frankiaceae bacterium]